MATANGFVDRTAELEFVLTKMTGRDRNAMLGISNSHYVSRDRADAWYQEMLSETVSCSDQAKHNLTDLYIVLIGR